MKFRCCRDASPFRGKRSCAVMLDSHFLTRSYSQRSRCEGETRDSGVVQAGSHSVTLRGPLKRSGHRCQIVLGLCMDAMSTLTRAGRRQREKGCGSPVFARLTHRLEGRLICFSCPDRSRCLRDEHQDVVELGLTTASSAPRDQREGSRSKAAQMIEGSQSGDAD